MSEYLKELLKKTPLDEKAMEILQAVKVKILPLLAVPAAFNPEFTIDLENEPSSYLEFKPSGCEFQKMYMNRVGDEIVPLIQQYDNVTKLVVQNPRGNFQISLFISGEEYVIPLYPVEI